MKSKLHSKKMVDNHQIVSFVDIFQEKRYELIEIIETKKIINGYKIKYNIDVSEYFDKKLEYRKHIDSGITYYSPLTCANEIFYNELQKNSWYYQTHKSEYVFCAKFTENKNVLEIGCGEGFFFKYTKASLYKGLEFNQQAINLCRNKELDVDKKSISEFSKLHPDEYDIVCSFQVLEHVDNPIQFIKDAIYCLKRHGLLLISVPSEDSFISLARNNVLNMPPHHVSRWPDSSFHYIAEKLNIKLLDIHHNELEPIHYDWYSSVLGQQIIKTWACRPSQKLFDKTIPDKITSKIGSLLGIFLRKAVTQKKILPRGHTVTAVFKKP